MGVSKPSPKQIIKSQGPRTILDEKNKTILY